MKTIAHCGFARVSTVRVKAPGTCAWCGNPGRFRYGTLPDDRLSGRPDINPRVFCSVGCFRAFAQ